MAPIRLQSMISFVLLCFLSRVTLADTTQDQPDLASQEINLETQYAENVTTSIDSHPTGWYKTKICSGDFCVLSNREVAKGRGVVLITTEQEKDLLKDLEANFNPGNQGNVQSPSIEVKDVPAKGSIYVGKETLRRGAQVMALTPVLLVHRDFFEDEPKEVHDRILEAAVNHLPDGTREKFNRQRKYPGGTRSIKEILLADPWEVALQFPPFFSGADEIQHFANYPEMSHFVHDCRPNVGAAIGLDLILRTAVARRVLPGDHLTITHLDPLFSREKRAEQSKQLMGHACTCASCTGGGGGNLEDMVKSDERMAEIEKLHKQLDNIHDKEVSTTTISRYLKLFEQEKLESRMAEAYWQAALNYNYLGHAKEALKYANRAVQAAIIEWGPESNDLAAMRVFVSDTMGHYSWQRRIKLREGKL